MPPLEKNMATVRWLAPFLLEPVKNTALLVYIGRTGTALTTGYAGDAALQFPADIVGWELLADQTGSIVIDIWKDTYANYPPTVGDTITAGSPPTISSASKARNAVPLRGQGSDPAHRWVTKINSLDTLRFSVTSVAGIQQVCLSLHLHRHPVV